MSQISLPLVVLSKKRRTKTKSNKAEEKISQLNIFLKRVSHFGVLVASWVNIASRSRMIFCKKKSV